MEAEANDVAQREQMTVAQLRQICLEHQRELVEEAPRDRLPHLVWSKRVLQQHPR